MPENEQTVVTKGRTEKRTYAEILNRAKLMIAGMQTHAEELTKRGIDAGFIAGMQTNASNLEKTNAEQEALKANLKTKTAEFDAYYLEMQKTMAEAKKLIKLTIPQSGWIEFGITDKR